jgi:pimeloyl-ACP methyl ester carboxylesterase
MFPFGIVRVWVLGIGGLLQVVGAIDYLRAWFATEPAKHRFLVQGTGMLVASFAIPLLALLFSHRRRPARSPLSNATTSFLDRPDGSRIFVESLGRADAPTIVLTHGWALDSTIWPTPFLERLATRWRVVRWDLPGLGSSTLGGNGAVNFDTLADDLDAVVGSIGDERPVLLVGHSIGGMILQTYARRFRDRFERNVVGIVLIDTTYTSPIHTATQSNKLTRLERPVIRPLIRVTKAVAPLVRLIDTLSYLNGSLHFATRLAMFGRSPGWSELDHLARLLSSAPPRVVMSGLQAMLDFDERETLPRIDVPTLLIVGQHDRWTPLACHQFMASQLPNARIDVAIAAGHLPFVEQPLTIATNIDTFFADCLDRTSLPKPHAAPSFSTAPEPLERR